MPALPSRMICNRSRLRHASRSRSARKRESHSSTAIASNDSCSMISRTAATLARDTCAVPSSVYSTPSRVMRASGCAASEPGSSGVAEATDDAALSILGKLYVCRAVGGRSIAVALEQILVGVDAAVAQERPDATHGFAARHVDVHDQQFAVIGGSLREHLALRPGDEARTPELQAAA